MFIPSNVHIQTLVPLSISNFLPPAFSDILWMRYEQGKRRGLRPWHSYAGCTPLQAKRISSVVAIFVFRKAEATFYTSATLGLDSQLSSEPLWVWTPKFLVWNSVISYAIYRKHYHRYWLKIRNQALSVVWSPARLRNAYLCLPVMT